jgi:hypothetical protein
MTNKKKEKLSGDCSGWDFELTQAASTQSHFAAHPIDHEIFCVQVWFAQAFGAVFGVRHVIPVIRTFLTEKTRCCHRNGSIPEK